MKEWISYLFKFTVITSIVVSSLYIVHKKSYNKGFESGMLHIMQMEAYK